MWSCVWAIYAWEYVSSFRQWPCLGGDHTLSMPGVGRLLAGGRCLESSLHSKGGVTQWQLFIGMVTLGMLN